MGTGREVYPELVEGSPSEPTLVDRSEIQAGFLFIMGIGREACPELVEGSPSEPTLVDPKSFKINVLVFFILKMYRPLYRPSIHLIFLS